MLRKGFTLIELLIVITIIAILAGAAIPYVQDYVEDARIAKARSDMDEIKNAITRYELDTGIVYTDATIATLVGPYLQKALIDPWGGPYTVSDTDSNIVSAGPDGTAGNGDDIALEYRPTFALSKCYWEDTNKDGAVTDGDALVFKFTRAGLNTQNIAVADITFETGAGALTAIGAATTWSNEDRQAKISLTTIGTPFVPGRDLISLATITDEAVAPYGPNEIKANGVKIQSY